MFLNTLWWAIAAGGKCTTYVIFEMRDNIKRTHTLTAQRHTQTAVHIQTVLVGTCFFLSVTAHTQWVFVYASKFIPFVSFIFHFFMIIAVHFHAAFSKDTQTNTLIHCCLKRTMGGRTFGFPWKTEWVARCDAVHVWCCMCMFLPMKWLTRSLFVFQ